MEKSASLSPIRLLRAGASTTSASLGSKMPRASMIPRQMIRKCLSLGLSRFMGEYVGYKRLKFSLRGLCSFEKPIPQVLIFL
ncbi:MAG: hypothetical protein VYC85_03760, partial [Pseudomonadota bacterium]|nr:hypothetical protein [Pseudomonadota bacterium]